MLSFENAGFSYSGRGTDSAILKNISFSISPGEFVVLMGQNGAGKTTLCRLANGIIKPTTGKVCTAGEDTRFTKVSAIARKAGYLFQNPDRQLCCNSVREEIQFGLEYALTGMFPPAATRAEKKEYREKIAAEKNRRCQEMLDIFGLDGNRDPFGLSRGERQQCALASVLARQPQLLILDEPTTGLDYRECVTIMEIIQKLNQQGTTVFMITHDMEVAADFAERALVLSKGELIGDGPAREILKNKDVLDPASLLPPQIASLAINLGQRFRDVFSLDEMYAVTEQALNKGGLS